MSTLGLDEDVAPSFASANSHEHTALVLGLTRQFGCLGGVVDRLLSRAVDSAAMREPMFTTPRMQLMRICAADLDSLVELDSDPEVMRYISGGTPNSRELYLDELLPRMLAWPSEPYGFMTAWIGDEFAGWFHLRPSVADASMLELGYRLRRATWGRGLATEGSRTLVRHAFETLGQDAVDACFHPGNVASMRVMQKCSMREVGTFVHPRASIEVIRYIVTRADYDQRDW